MILDEIGAGTDPGEGMGIAVSVLEEIYAKGAVMLATTHLVDEEMKQQHEKQLERIKEVKKGEKAAQKLKRKSSFNVGDCVYISTMGRTGIVCQPENNKGEVTVMVMKNKFKINHKRLSLYVEGKDLYPDIDNYDMDIVLETKENRKKKKILSKRHVDGLIIE